MAEIRGFRAIRYYFDADDRPADLLAPPYDVINSAEQDSLYARHPANITRLVLGRPQARDDGENNRYTRARRHLMDWLATGQLRQDDRPGLYVHEQTFSDAQGRQHTRHGFLGAVRLADYDEKIVLPHELTLSGPKADRLELMKNCEANLSPIFFLYDDPEGKVDALLAAHREMAMEVDVTTEADGIRHQLWPVFDAEVQAQVAEILKDAQLLIADGHHRYETALAYRDFRRAVAEDGPAEEPAPFEYVMGFLVNIHDPGLQVFGTHRAVHDVPNFDAKALLKTLEESNLYELKLLARELVDTPLQLEVLLAEAAEEAPSFILLSRDLEQPVLVQYRGDETAPIFDAETPAPVRRLDVSILHEGIFDRIMGISRQAQAAKTNLRYFKSLVDAVDAHTDPEHQLVVLMNPTPVAQVIEVCQSGGKMPQKSTYFYPKILSGLAINPL